MHPVNQYINNISRLDGFFQGIIPDNQQDLNDLSIDYTCYRR
jgi:hypothetical protein